MGSKARAEAFSDGIFAIAATLLVLDIGVPRPDPTLLDGFLHEWPAYAAYATSFLTIGIIWVNHHALIDNVSYVDRTLLFLNLLLLLFVVMIPFATATMAGYLTSGGQDSHVAMVLYGLVLEGMALCFTAMFGWSLGEGRTKAPVPAEARRTAWLRFSMGAAAYVVAIAVALVSAPASLLMIALVAVYYIAERTPTGGAPSD